MPEARSETKLFAARNSRRPRLGAQAQGVPIMAAYARKHWSQASGLAPCRNFTVMTGHFAELIRGLRVLLGISLLLAALLAGCGSSLRSKPSPLFGTGVFHPPPKPGASISQTRMCECKACEPSKCCEGPDEDAPTPTCNSYDFSDPACGGISISSCTSRCTRQVWRVRTDEACSDKRPLTCCLAG